MAGRLALAALAALVAAPSGAAARPGQVVAVEHVDATPTLGRADALVTIDLYFVPGAEPSHAAYRAVRDLAQRHPARVRARFWPRTMGARQGTPALALAAHRVGKFFAYMDALAASSPPLGPAGSLALAVELGLDRDAAARAARDPALVAALATAEHRAFRTPAMQAIEIVLNGQPVSLGPVRLNPGGFAANQLEQAYQVALAEARLAAAQGLTGGALRRWGRLHTYCADLDADVDDDAPPIADRPPRYAWSLARLLDGGTTCAPPPNQPARVDDPRFSDGDPPPARLLAAPLPPAGAASLGPVDAAVPIVVACNPRGDACRAQLSALAPLVDIYEGEVRLSWAPFIDLGFEAAADDVALAGAAQCAAALGDGWPFASDPPGVRREPPTLADFAREAHVDPADVAGCLAGSGDRVRTAVAAAERAGVVAGPTVVIGGRAYVGGFVDARAAALVVEATLAPGLLEQLAP